MKEINVNELLLDTSAKVTSVFKLLKDELKLREVRIMELEKKLAEKNE